MSDDPISVPDSKPEWRRSRRRFLELSATAVGATLLSSGIFIGASRAATGPASSAGSHGADALLLTCMDYRLANEVAFFMNEHAMTNKYDQVILAGATLGVATDKFPAWAETFWQHLDLAVELHNVKRVIAIDHRDCGAFKLAYGQDFGADPTAETEIHTQVMSEFRRLVKEKQPGLDVELLLMYLDGQAQLIG